LNKDWKHSRGSAAKLLVRIPPRVLFRQENKLLAQLAKRDQRVKVVAMRVRMRKTMKTPGEKRTTRELKQQRMILVLALLVPSINMIPKGLVPREHAVAQDGWKSRA
jgi:hypothetical protein